MGSKFFSFRVDPFSEGQNNMERVTTSESKIISLKISNFTFVTTELDLINIKELPYTNILTLSLTLSSFVCLKYIEISVITNFTFLDSKVTVYCDI